MSLIDEFVKNLDGKPIAVFGLGASGMAVVRAFAKAGAEVRAFDDDKDRRDEAKKAGAVFEKLTPENLKSCAFLVLAPGVQLHYPQPHEVVKAARKAGTEIICDIELFYRLSHGRKTVGITGTNGKSTTTALITHVLNENDVEAVMGGNIGRPVFDLEMPGPAGLFVFELSSYQLDLCPTFHPDISVLLNITPDHLDRHGSMENYAAAKARIFEGPGLAVITGTDQYSQAIKNRISREQLLYPEKIQEHHALRGRHNLQNMQVAYAVCRALGLNENQIFKGFETFSGLPHRQFPVRKIGQVTYINDSKATNAEAVSKALASYENIHWIAGGLAKDGGLEGLEELTPRIAQAYLIGAAEKDFAAWMECNSVAYEKCGTLDVAVRKAHKNAQEAKEESVVLLAPACASFDQYKSFGHRGGHFTELVLDLKGREAA